MKRWNLLATPTHKLKLSRLRKGQQGMQSHETITDGKNPLNTVLNKALFNFSCKYNMVLQNQRKAQVCSFSPSTKVDALHRSWPKTIFSRNWKLFEKVVLVDQPCFCSHLESTQKRTSLVLVHSARPEKYKQFLLSSDS